VVEPKDFKEIKTIIDLMKKNGLSVFEIEKEGFRLKMERGPSGHAAAVSALPMAVPPKAATAPTESAPGLPKAIESVPLKEIASPMVGTFYRAASPDGPPFVDVGKTLRRKPWFALSRR
jgi:acetyl-CoA carboxylase biotin carboxyl carrier protein